jgi:chemotaxis response regulator CheB
LNTGFPHNKTPFIVVIEISSGEMESLKSFFAHALSNESIAYLLIPHSDIKHFNVVKKLVQEYTSIEVVTIKNQQKIKANYVYILPPGSNLNIHEDQFQLLNLSSGINNKPPLDYFLSCIAKNSDIRSVSILVSKMRNPGTSGIKLYREKGGIVLISQIKSTQSNAIVNILESSLVDYMCPSNKAA